MTRLFTFIRSLVCPFDKIEPFVPKKGKILDLGCGHGIFCALLAKKSHHRMILGIDPSEKKIQLAQKSYNGLKNLKFQKAYLKDIKRKNFDCISIIDVFYLLPDKEKEEMLKMSFQKLKVNGIMILHNTSSKYWLYKLAQLEEKLTVQFFKYTYSDTNQLYFLPDSAYQRLLKKTGFYIDHKKIIQGIPYKQQLIIAKKISSKYEK